MATSTLELKLPPPLTARPSKPAAQPGSVTLRDVYSLRRLVRKLRREGAAFIIAATGLYLLSRYSLLPPMNPTRVIILALIVIAMHAWLSVGIGAPVIVSLPFSVLFIAHPLVRSWIVDSPPTASLMGLGMVPLLVLLATKLHAPKSTAVRVMLGVLIGITVTIFRSGSTWVMALALMLIFQERCALSATVAAALRKSLADLVVIAAVGTVVAAGVHWTLIRWGVLSIQANVVSLPSIAPLALVDRAGWVASRLHGIPKELTAIAGAAYLGWSLLALALIGVTERHQAETRKRIALITSFALTALWCGLADQSMHDSLRELFEYVTLKRRIDPLTLNCFGLLILPLLALALIVFRCVICLVTPSSRKPPFVALFIGGAATLAWWTTCPANLSAALAARLLGAETNPVLPILLSFSMTTVAASGSMRLIRRCRNRTSAALVWVIILLVTVLDLRALPRVTPQPPTDKTAPVVTMPSPTAN